MNNQCNGIKRNRLKTRKLQAQNTSHWDVNNPRMHNTTCPFDECISLELTKEKEKKTKETKLSQNTNRKILQQRAQHQQGGNIAPVVVVKVN